MKKVILYIASSLDGQIAKVDGSVDWLDHNVDFGKYNIDRFLENIGSILIGRKTYEQSLEFGDWYFKNQDTYVFSRRGVEIRSPRTQLVDGELISFVRNLRSGKGKNIWLNGGADLNRQFLEGELIDEIILCIQPVCLGKGIGLFGDQPQTNLHKFRLADSVSSNGSMLLHYQRP